MVYYSTSILLKEYDKKGFYQNFFYMVIWYVYLLLWNWDVIYISKLYYLSLRLGGIHVISWRYQPVRGISRSRVKIDIEWSHKFRIMSWRESRDIWEGRQIILGQLFTNTLWLLICIVSEQLALKNHTFLEDYYTSSWGEIICFTFHRL